MFYSMYIVWHKKNVSGTLLSDSLDDVFSLMHSKLLAQSGDLATLST